MQRMSRIGTQYIDVCVGRNFRNDDNCALGKLNDLSPFQQETKILSLPKGPSESYATSLGYCKD